MLVVEVTGVHGPLVDPGAFDYVEKLSLAVASELCDRLPTASTVQAFLHPPIPRQGRPVQQTARDVADAIEKGLRQTELSDTFEITHPVRVQVHRRGFQEKIACSHFIHAGADSKDIALVMRAALEEARAKFEGYLDTCRIMLFVSSHFFFMDERRLYVEAMGMVSQEARTAVDKIYALTSTRRIIRLK